MATCVTCLRVLFSRRMLRPPTRSALEKLAAFAGPFSTPGATFGEWAPAQGTGSDDDPCHFPWFRFSELGSAFFDMIYEEGWVLTDFDWSSWKETPEARGFAADVAAVEAADGVQLAKLITLVARQDRYSEGTLEWAFNSGLLGAIAERAEALLRNGEGRSTIRSASGE